MITVQQLLEDFSSQIQFERGSIEARFSSVSPVDQGGETTLRIVNDQKRLKALKNSPQGIVIVPQDAPDIDFFEGTVLSAKKPEWIKALILEKYYQQDKVFWQSITEDNSIDPSAQVHPTAQVAPGTVIGPRAIIGPETVIAPQCVIENDVTIGRSCHIKSRVTLCHGSELGDHVVVGSGTVVGSEGYGYTAGNDGHAYAIPQVGNVKIASYVEIGANCTIDRGALQATEIGAHTKIDNLCHIAHNCKIGPDSMLTGGFMVAGSTTIGKNFRAGGATGVSGHLHIADNVTLAGASVVTRSIPKPGVYGGHPIMPISSYLKSYALIESLPELRRQLRRALKALKLDKE